MNTDSSSHNNNHPAGVFGSAEVVLPGSAQNHGACETVSASYSESVRSLVLYSGPQWGTCNADLVFYQSKKGLLFKSNFNKKKVGVNSKQQERTLITHVSAVAEGHLLSDVFINFDALPLTGRTDIMVASTDIFDEKMCPYCHDKTQIDNPFGFVILKESRGSVPFVRASVCNHNMRRAEVDECRQKLQEYFPDYAWFIPVKTRYGCVTIRGLPCKSRGVQQALNSYVTQKYLNFGKKKKYDWPLIFPISLLSGHALTIAMTAVECLMYPDFQLTDRCRRRQKGEHIAPAVKRCDWLPSDILLNLHFANDSRKARSTEYSVVKGTVFSGNYFNYDLRDAVSISKGNRCPCGFQGEDMAFFTHMVECFAGKTRVVVCGCGEEFRNSKSWSAYMHFLECPESPKRTDSYDTIE